MRLALSFVLAVALWLYVTGKENPNVTFALQQPLPIFQTHVGTNLVVTRAPTTAYVRYRVASPNMQVNSANFRVSIDLLNLKPGTHRHIRVTCQADPGISCISVKPRTASVVIDQKQQAQVPVTYKRIGSPPPGYYVASTQIFPSTVGVTGPSSIVSQVNGAVVNVKLSGLTSSLTAPYQPVLVDSKGAPVSGSANLQSSPQQVTVHVAVKPLSSFKPLPVIISLKGRPRSGFGVTGVLLTPPEVTVQGSPDRLRKVKTLATQPVSLTGRRGPFQQTVRLKLPRGVTSSTGSVQLKIKIQPVDTGTSLDAVVTTPGLAPGLKAHVTPKRELVYFVGPASGMRGIARRLHVSVNLANYGIGTYHFTPSVSVPPGFRVTGAYPQQVTVTITG